MAMCFLCRSNPFCAILKSRTYEQTTDLANLAGHARAERLHCRGAPQAASSRGGRKDQTPRPRRDRRHGFRVAPGAWEKAIGYVKTLGGIKAS